MKQAREYIKMRIAFIDLSCPQIYDHTALSSQGLGGTEASVVRLATALGARDHKVLVVQHLRTLEKSERGVIYGSMESLMGFRPEVVICLRDVRMLSFMAENFPDAKLFLWLHDLEELGASQLTANIPLLKYTAPRIVGVSRFHKTGIIDCIQVGAKGETGLPEYTVTYIYNPIDDELVADGRAYDKNKILFLSSPHKGLDHVLKLFALVRQKFPRVKLYVANPGYYKDKDRLPEGVVPLGTRPHHEVIDELRTSLCLFYPNPDYFTRETYGLVAAEAQAVGCPPLVHPAGALNEIVTTKECFVDARNPREVLQRFRKWYVEGRPKVSLDLPTRTSQVVLEWEKEFRQ